MPGDFDEFDIIERHAKEAAARRLEEAKAANEAMQARDAQETAERQARATALTLATNERFRQAEYDRHGVEPPEGFPVSIGFLFKFGWKVEETLGQRRLIPPDPEKPKRKTREDYHRDRGT